MKLSAIVIKIRAATTRFNNRVAGAAEIADVFQNTHKPDTAFVIQINEEAPKNEVDSAINQKLTEQFAVVVALANDSSQADKLGLTAYDSLHTIRAQLFKALLGWQMEGFESLVCYRGGKLLGFDRAYLWYQFVFEADTRLTQDDGVDPDSCANFDTIYAQYITSPDAYLPYEASLPARDSIVDQTQQIDLTEDPDAGAFSSAFSLAFDVYTG